MSKYNVGLKNFFYIAFQIFMATVVYKLRKINGKNDFLIILKGVNGWCDGAG